ncbi:MAG: CDP-alcohol phosphatidyltransferase family protein, partial [Deltaproteobacteria bacterium]|nr:CDP-alcohol phosphatidyltransferase family protein [Deltaproteobacteria bacterium]
MTTKRPFSMIRDFHLADWFTLGNAFCGTGAIFAALRFLQDGRQGDLLLGMGLIPIAFVFDALDGRIARSRHSSSVLGRELDSLSDVISFGVAPAALAYACGMQGGWDWLILSYFVCCGVSRLARYNVTAESLTGDEGKVSHFEGTPIPTSLALVVVLAVATWQDRIGER